MNHYIEIAQAFERVIHKYNKSENAKRDYGTDIMLTRKEIHTIQLIGQYPQIGIVELSQLQGVTKGATSQMVKKLVEKGLVIKKQSKVSEAEIGLELTKLGQKAFKGHEDYHENFGKQWKQLLDQMSQNDLKVLMKFINFVEKILDREELKEIEKGRINYENCDYL